MQRTANTEPETSLLAAYQKTPNTDVYIWLMSLRVSKAVEEEIPQKFIDGTLLCEILQRLEGRSCRLGFHSHPKTLSACRANIKLALEHLRDQSKFNSDYLWSYDDILKGNPEVIWGLLTDLKKFYPKYRLANKLLTCPGKPIRPSSASIFQSRSVVEAPAPTARAWVNSMNLSYLLKFGSGNYIKDPLRNGVLLCKVLSKLKEPFEHFTHPKSAEEVWENIHAVVKAMNSDIQVANAEGLTEVENVWNLLEKMQKTYQRPVKSVLPYTESEIKALQHSVFKWVYSMKVFDQVFPENFSALSKSLKTGVILIRLVEKVCKADIEYIKYPNTKKECIGNIESSLATLRRAESMSKGFIWDSEAIYSSDSSYILAMLEDIHRLYQNLPARIEGEDYHNDGPFLGQHAAQDLRKSRLQFDYQSSSVYQSPSGFETLSKSFIVQSASPFSAYSSFRNLSEAASISPKRKPRPQLNLEGFEWIKAIQVKFPKTLNMQGDKISEFRTGEILCEIMQILEARTLHGVRKALKGSAAAAKNVNIVFEILRKKPRFSADAYYLERDILSGNGDSIRMVLKEIYRIYENTILALIKFKGKAL